MCPDETGSPEQEPKRTVHASSPSPTRHRSDDPVVDDIPFPVHFGSLVETSLKKTGSILSEDSGARPKSGGCSSARSQTDNADAWCTSLNLTFKREMEVGVVSLPSHCTTPTVSGCPSYSCLSLDRRRTNGVWCFTHPCHLLESNTPQAAGGRTTLSATSLRTTIGPRKTKGYGTRTQIVKTDRHLVGKNLFPT